MMRRIKIYPERIGYNVGETVAGYVEVLSDDDFDFTEMYIDLVCREHTYFTEGSGDDEETFSEEYFHHSERMIIKEPGRFYERSMRVPFNFPIPEHLPTSYDGASGWIEYTLEAKIGVKWRLDPRDQVQIFVTGKPEYPNPQLLRQSLLDGETILLDMELERDSIYLGEDLVIHYRVEESSSIRGVRFDLLARELAVAEGNDDTSEKVMHSKYVDNARIVPRSWNKIELETDESMLATYRGPLITLSIILKIVLDIPWKLDKDLKMEITSLRRLKADRDFTDKQYEMRDDIFD